MAKKPTELVDGQWTTAGAGKLQPNMTRRSSLRAIPQNSAKRCKPGLLHKVRGEGAIEGERYTRGCCEGDMGAIG